VDIDHLKRDVAAIKQQFSESDNETLIAKAPIHISIPEYYQRQKLVHIETTISIVGIFAFYTQQHYCVHMAPTMVRIEPDDILTHTIEDEVYFDFFFEKGSTIISNLNTVKDNTLLYDIYNQFILKGHVPWYIDYRDLGELFSLSEKYASLKLGANPAIMELFAATIARSEKEPKVQYRHVATSVEDIKTNPPVIVGLRNVSYSATNTTAKLLGSYWNDGLISALNHPSTTLEPIEQLLRQ
jgi:hypothetical protein